MQQRLLAQNLKKSTQVLLEIWRCPSFNGNKIITTGGGGAILTNNKDLLKRQTFELNSKIKDKKPWDYVHDDIGYNYKLPDLNAALV